MEEGPKEALEPQQPGLRVALLFTAPGGKGHYVHQLQTRPLQKLHNLLKVTPQKCWSWEVTPAPDSGALCGQQRCRRQAGTQHFPHTVTGP